MNINKLAADAKAQGYEIAVDKTGRQYAYTIISTNCPDNPHIHTDRRGLELFLQDGIDAYLHYCEMAGVEPFS